MLDYVYFVSILIILSGIKDAVVVDIGGTSTDVGMLVNGFPRPAAVRVKVPCLLFVCLFILN